MCRFSSSIRPFILRVYAYSTNIRVFVVVPFDLFLSSCPAIVTLRYVVTFLSLSLPYIFFLIPQTSSRLLFFLPPFVFVYAFSFGAYRNTHTHYYTRSARSAFSLHFITPPRHFFVFPPLFPRKLTRKQRKGVVFNVAAIIFNQTLLFEQPVNSITTKRSTRGYER